MSKKRLLLTSLFFLLIGLGAFYFYQLHKPHYAKVSLHYDPSIKIPSFDIEIEAQKYRVELDTGSEQYLSLLGTAVNQIKTKRFLGFQSFFDISNVSHQVSSFEIPKIKISNFTAFPIELLEEDEAFMMKDGYIGESSPEEIRESLKGIDGRVGISLFENFCLLIDLPHSIMYIAKDLDALSEEGIFSRQNFTEVPLAFSKWVVFLTDTEFGTKKLLLDTGAAFSTWHSEHTSQLETHTIQHLRLGNKDFGSYDFATFDLPKALNVDGILGIDFLEKHIVLIDLKNQRAFVH
jgi:hypothetical protein